MATLRTDIDPQTGEILEPDPEHMAADLLRAFDDGDVSRYATEKLRELLDRCRLIGRKGTLTWQITVTPSGEELAVGIQVTSKPPEPDATVHKYFTDEDGNLTQDNPRKRPLPGFEKVTGLGRRRAQPAGPGN